MPRKDWFRRTTWTEQDSADFAQRLQRARPENRPQYVRIQAVALHATAEPSNLRAALSLLDYFFRNWPEDIFLANAFWQAARCHEELDEEQSALLAYRRPLDAQRGRPNVQPPTALDLGMFVLRLGRTDLYAEVLSVLNEFAREQTMVFPVERYHFHLIHALLAARTGNDQDARPHAVIALDEAKKTQTGIPHHPTLGLVDRVDARLHDELAKIVGA